jgi:hypothetical protein
MDGPISYICGMNNPQFVSLVEGFFIAIDIVVVILMKVASHLVSIKK